MVNLISRFVQGQGPVVPKFGSWDAENIGYTVFFDKVRENKTAPTPATAAPATHDDDYEFDPYEHYENLSRKAASRPPSSHGHGHGHAPPPAHHHHHHRAPPPPQQQQHQPWQWQPPFQPPAATSFWQRDNVREHVGRLQETIELATAVWVPEPPKASDNHATLSQNRRHFLYC